MDILDATVQHEQADLRIHGVLRSFARRSIFSENNGNIIRMNSTADLIERHGRISLKFEDAASLV